MCVLVAKLDLLTARHGLSAVWQHVLHNTLTWNKDILKQKSRIEGNNGMHFVCKGASSLCLYCIQTWLCVSVRKSCILCEASHVSNVSEMSRWLTVPVCCMYWPGSSSRHTLKVIYKYMRLYWGYQPKHKIKCSSFSRSRRTFGNKLLPSDVIIVYLHVHCLFS
jgi:hypothetical protein